MSRNKAIGIVFLSAAVGLAIGVAIADWRFHNPDVLLSSRILLGFVGAMIGGYGGKWFTGRTTKTKAF